MKRICIGALCLALIGCAPPYLEVLNKSAGLTHQMTLVGTVGPANTGSAASDVRFFPVKPSATSIGSVSVQSGFAVWDSAAYESLSFVYPGSSDSGSTSQTFSLVGADANYPLYKYDVTAATLSGQASILVFKFDPSVSTSTYQQFVAPPAGGSMSSPTGQLPLTSLNTIFAGQAIIGTCDLPPAAGAQDTFAFLGQSAGILAVGTATLNGSATAFPVGGVMTAATATIPGSVSRYAYNPSTTASYSACYNGSSWSVQQWIGAGVTTVMTGMSHRLDGILTTGDLVSTEGGVLRLYDAAGTGTELYAIPLNGLQYCYEAYVGSTPYVFFSLPILTVHSDWVFNVYAVPTSSMRGLRG